MKDFIAIDFETANSKRVSACALGIVRVSDCKIVDSSHYYINPVGGHAEFQTGIHGITEEHTFDKPDFGELFSEIREILDHPLVAHSQFDKQVLNALSVHFDLGFSFNYYDSSLLARKKLPDLQDSKLKTIAKHFGLPAFKHHDAKEDAEVCAKIFLKMHGYPLEDSQSPAF